MKSNPWIQPVYFTASGIPAMYLSGIAIPSSNKNEIPSATPAFLNKSIVRLLSDMLVVYFAREGRTCRLATQHSIVKLHYAFPD